MLQIGDGIARIYGLENAVAMEMLELEHGVVGLGVQPRGGRRRRRALRRVAEGERGRAGPPHRADRERARRRGAARPRRRLARQPARRPGPARDGRDAAARVQGARRHRAAAGEGAAPDRDQGDRLDDERRSRPARADHRRPLHREDGHRDRRDPQPARPEREVRLRRRRPEGVDGRPGLRAAEGSRRDVVHDDRLRAGARGGARSSGWRRSPAARWASTSSTRASTRSSSTTT